VADQAASIVRLKIGDAFGQQLLAQYRSHQKTVELIEREDGFIAIGSHPGLYTQEYSEWSESERSLVDLAAGPVLDIGCGAGRHSLYLQQAGIDVTAIDVSPGAVKVAKLRGVKRAQVRSVADVGQFKPKSFRTLLMLGNNFGLFGSAAGAKRILRTMSRITTEDARIMVGARNPYKTKDPNHLEYQQMNLKRGRMAGQVKMRVRFERIASKWFDYLLVSPDEMRKILEPTDWRVEKFVGIRDPNYCAIFRKRV
jgi:SAM-dependent methyltransferase